MKFKTGSSIYIIMKTLNIFYIFSAIMLISLSYDLKLEALVTPSKHKYEKTHTSVEKNVSAELALTRLKTGNTNYINGAVRKDGQSQKDRARLVPSQKPHTIIFSCADSRVPPEIIFDQKLGELFVVRTAGEAVDNMAIASIEYAVEHLETPLLLVLGHESCGAVTAAFATFKSKDAGSPALNELVKDIQPRIRQYSGKRPSSRYLSEVKANTLGVASDLIARSNIIAEKYKKNELKIETAIYHLNSGWVEFYSDAPVTNLIEKP